MSEIVYMRICKVFDYNEDSLKLSYDNKILLEKFQELDIYKTILFELCFLINKGSVEFKNINDIWFFKNFSHEEIEIAFEIIDILLKKIENININDDEYIKPISKFMKLNNNKKKLVFKYLQSIYFNCNKQFNFIIFPLIYALGFDNDALKYFLKDDLKNVINNYIKKIDSDDNIYYHNIDEQFLCNLNKLLYYINFNDKNPKEKKDINPLYNYLSNYGEISQIPNDFNEKYPQQFNYFFEIENLIKAIESEEENTKTKKNKSGEKADEKNGGDNNEVNGDLNKHSKNINTNSVNNGNTKISIEKDLNKDLSMNNKNNISNDIREIIREEIKVYFDYYDKRNKLKDLCARIPHIFNDIKLSKESLDNYYSILFEIRETKLLINKLSSNNLFLGASDLFNYRRKLLEVISFNIIEKYPDYFSFTGKYIPNIHDLNNLKTILSGKLQNCESSEKNKINDDLERLNNLINNKAQNTSAHCSILINEKNKIGKQIKMVLDFLNYYKKQFFPNDYMDKNKADNYIFPRSLFSSNLKYADYILSLDDTNKQNCDNKKEDKNEINIENINNEFRLYKDEKIININEALKILFSNNYNDINEFVIDKQINEKIKLRNKSKIFNQNIDSFYNIFSFGKDDEFILNDEIKENENDIINKLKDFDVLISKILENELKREENQRIIENIKELIEYEVREAKKIFIESEKISIEQKIKLINSKYNRINLILNFLIDQKEKINNARKNIYEEKEKYLNNLINQTNIYNNFHRIYLSNDSFTNLFDEWSKTAKEKYDEKYINLDTILNNLKDLLESVHFDYDYSNDEKFVLWTIQNDFSKYLK